MKIEKLPSGSYRVRKMYKGVPYTVVFDHKPTQKEALQTLANEMNKAKADKQRMTFKTAALRYNKTKSNILSPSTIRGYSSILRSINDDFKSMLLSDITAADVQEAINDYSSGHSPKTVRNMHGFINAVMSLYSPNTQLNTTLPKYVCPEKYMPADSDIKIMRDAVQGTKFEIPFLLGVFALRRSEVCALDIDDVADGEITIHRAKVMDDSGNWVIKNMTKTEEGMRTIAVPLFLTDAIKKQGYVYKGHPNNLLKHFNLIQDALGLERFSFHSLRHYYASMAHSTGMPDVYIMAAGGWKSEHVMKKVYRHAMKDKKKEMESKAINYVTELLS